MNAKGEVRQRVGSHTADETKTKENGGTRHAMVKKEALASFLAFSGKKLPKTERKFPKTKNSESKKINRIRNSLLKITLNTKKCNFEYLCRSGFRVENYGFLGENIDFLTDNIYNTIL